MSEKTPSPMKLEKQLRLLEKKLEVSEQHRVKLEEQHDLDQQRLKELDADLQEAKTAVEATLQEFKAMQQQLVQQEKLASLGALTAGIAHEIKNPLNFITGFSSVSRDLADELENELAGEPDPEEVHAILADIKSNAERIEQHGRRADQIVRSMMLHARTGSGDRVQVGLNALVDEYVELAWHGRRAQQPDFHVEIERDYCEEVGRVGAVPQDLGRVVLNLVSNAFDAVAEKAALTKGQHVPRVRISTSLEAQHAVVRVSDNGTGISADVRERLFEAFFTTKPAGAGTGLGLAMSYEIITSGHGGTLEAVSEDKEGATFIVRLPRGDPEGA